MAGVAGGEDTHGPAVMLPSAASQNDREPDPDRDRNGCIFCGCGRPYLRRPTLTWQIHSGHGSRAAMLAVGVAAALAAGVSLAPATGAGASPTAATWTVQPSPNPKGALDSRLRAVSCSGPGSCVAVGSSDDRSGKQVHQNLLVERLSGGVWTVVSTPAISGAVSSTLSGVSCPVAGFCVAVGYVHFANRPTGLLAEMWNGASWSDTLLPAPPGGTLPSVAAVSCAAEGACVAVGRYLNKAGAYRLLAERLTGSTWTVLATPTPPHAGDSEFTAVDCPTTTFCEAVGNVAYNDTLQNVFAYGLSGSTWTYQRMVNPGPDPGDTAYAVSCSDASACTSAGSVTVIGESALAEHWNGSSWVRQAIPAQVKRPANALYGVSCNGGSFCVSVGESWRVDRNGHLIDGRVMGQVWNGTAWSQSPPVVPSGESAGLNAISCPSPTACIAVGAASTASAQSTLVEAYTG